MIAYALGLSLSFMCVLYHNHGLAEAACKTIKWNLHLWRLERAKPWSGSGNPTIGVSKQHHPGRTFR